jgi:hypothetical protein
MKIHLYEIMNKCMIAANFWHIFHSNSLDTERNTDTDIRENLIISILFESQLNMNQTMYMTKVMMQ